MNVVDIGRVQVVGNAGGVGAESSRNVKRRWDVVRDELLFGEGGDGAAL